MEPACVAAGASAAEDEAAAADVLVVEDEALVLLLLREVLEEAGLRVATAADAAAVLAALDGPAADASVLVTDLDLGPGPDGAAVAAEARRRRPGLRAVYATGNPDLLRAADLRSGDRVYAKPFDALALAAEVRAMVRGASSGTPGGTATGLGRG